MKLDERNKAIELRQRGHSINKIAQEIGVAKSSVSIWVRDVHLTDSQIKNLNSLPFTNTAIENRRKSRIKNELSKRLDVISKAKLEIPKINLENLWLIGIMLYWAEGGKTQRMVRFSNGDPEMIKIMIKFFKIICKVPNKKLRGHIHIHEGLDSKAAEKYWSKISGIPIAQFFKTYQKPNKGSLNKKHSLPYGVMDIYVLNAELFNKISGWAAGIFDKSKDIH
ncbi:MAG: helix-turn-helix domain-containing protein [Candidatus Saccharibacteria bacterium]